MSSKDKNERLRLALRKNLKKRKMFQKKTKIAAKLEENFHFFNLKTDEEKQRIMRKNFKTSLEIIK